MDFSRASVWGFETPTNPSIYEAMLDAVLFEAGPFEEANKFLWQQMGVEPKIGVGKHLQIIHFNRVFHEINHPFWWFYPYFWKHPDFALRGIGTVHTLECLTGRFLG